MNRPIISLCVFAMILDLAGCKHEPPTYTVCLLDVSKSITPQGVQDEFKAVGGLVDRMHRGDRFTIIPITGNAAAETPGHVLTLSAPARRQAYDADLTVFRQDAHRDIAKLRDILTANPSNRTDILGALDVAQEEFEATTEDTGTPDLRQFLFVFSDFIEDDRTYRFTSTTGASSREVPNALAARLQREHHFALPESVNVKLIKLQSSDAQKLNAREDSWIRAFWTAYFLPCNAQWTPLDASIH